MLATRSRPTVTTRSRPTRSRPRSNSAFECRDELASGHALELAAGRRFEHVARRAGGQRDVAGEERDERRRVGLRDRADAKAVGGARYQSREPRERPLAG